LLCSVIGRIAVAVSPLPAIATDPLPIDCCVNFLQGHLHYDIELIGSGSKPVKALQQEVSHCISGFERLAAPEYIDVPMPLPIVTEPPDDIDPLVSFTADPPESESTRLWIPK
jgi:hypothetical protein